MAKKKKVPEVSEITKAIEKFDAELTPEQRLFMQDMAIVAEMPYEDFCLMIINRVPGFVPTIIVYANLDKTKKVAFKNLTDKEPPTMIMIDNEMFLSTSGYCRQDLEPKFEFFTPTFEQLKVLSKKNREHHKKGVLLYKLVGTVIKEKFSSNIMKILK
jgi:hypothetical protein